MKTFSLALHSIASHRLSSVLCVLATAAGIALLSSTFLFSQAIADGFSRNAHGIDMIVGTKGSPLQLVLSSIYHADVPAGNIDMNDYEKLKHYAQIKKTIPLALGDNFRGWRIVGTTEDYIRLYNAKIAQGQSFDQDYDVVAGALTDVAIGSTFAARHGYAADSDDVHNFHLYKVVGRLKPTHTVLDKLLITTLNSVQQLHAHPDVDDPDAENERALGHQLTAVVVQTRGATALLNLPHQINNSTNMMAAVPSYEIARFANTIGFGRNVIIILSACFLTLSGLMLFAFMAANLVNRRYDLAILRVLGASRRMIAMTIIFEALILTLIGSMIGLIIGRTLIATVFLSNTMISGFIMPQQLFNPQQSDICFIGISILIGILSAALPARTAARSDLAGLLAQGRT